MGLTIPGVLRLWLWLGAMETDSLVNRAGRRFEHLKRLTGSTLKVTQNHLQDLSTSVYLTTFLELRYIRFAG